MKSNLYNQTVCENCCPVEKTINLVGSKWNLMIIKQLCFANKPTRFNELLRSLKPVSSKTLSAKLKDLLVFEVVEKNIIPVSPPRVEYSLTEKGEDFMKVLKAMGKWSAKWHAVEDSKEENINI